MAWDENEEGSLSGEEEELAKELQATEDHTILLIDARPFMLRAGSDGEGEGEGTPARCPLGVALEAAQAVLRRIILQGGGGQRNKVGIMLFGAEQEEAEEDEEGEGEGKEAGGSGGFGGGGDGFGGAVGGQHFFLQPLAPPNATRIGQLGRLCKPGVDLTAELRLRWPKPQATEGGGGSSGGSGSALHKALRTCLRTLESSSRKVDRDAKRIWLFTNEDDPGAGGATEAAEPTRQGIKDALDSRAEVRLYFFPVPLGDEGEAEQGEGEGKRRGGGGFRDFDVRRFYEPLLAKQALGHAEWEGDGDEWDDEDEAGPDDAKLVDAMVGGVARLKEEMGKRAFRKRRYARMSLYLAPAEMLEGAEAAAASGAAEEEGCNGIGNGNGKGGLTLAVALYKTVQPAKKPAPVQLAAATNRRLVASTRHLSEALVKYVDLEMEARHSLDFCGVSLEWGKAQFDAVKRAGRGPPGVHVLGFVPAADLAWELSVGGPTLLYPEESLLNGCTRAFIALREAMLQRRVMALVRFHATARAEPRMAVLLAHPDSPGLEMVKLPFLDDVRSVVLPSAAVAADAPRPSRGTVAAAAHVVRAVLPREEFAPDGFTNPALHKFFTVLEALALEEEGREWDEEAEDDTFVQWEKNDNARRKLEQVSPALTAWAEACQDDCGPDPGATGKGKGKGKAAAAARADGGGGGGKKRKANTAVDEEEDGESLGSGGGGKKKAKKPAAKKKARAVVADDDDMEEEDEWGEKAGGGGRGGDGDEVDTMEAVSELIETGGINKLKMDEIKGYCRALGVGVTGKKADLIDRLKQVVE